MKYIEKFSTKVRNFQQNISILHVIQHFVFILFYKIFFSSRIKKKKKNGEITVVTHVANFLHDIFLLYTNIYQK